MKETPAQILLFAHLLELTGGGLTKEHVFAEGRKFAFDIADEENRIGYECDGGQFSGGHMRGTALEKQYEKDRLAQILGWRIFRFTNRQVLNGEARAWLAKNVYGEW